MNKERESNIELLRILAMLGIVIYHLYLHCVDAQLNDGTNNLFNNPVFYKQLLVLATMSPLGKIGDVISIVISGYFMVERKYINLAKISKKLLLQLGFVSGGLVVGSFVLYKTVGSVLVPLFSVNVFNEGPWFIGYYFIVITIASLYLNRYLIELDREKYLTLLLVLVAITQFSFSRILFENISSNLFIIIIGIFLYALGGFIRRFNPFGKIKPSVLIIVIFMSLLFIWLSAYNQINYDIQIYNGNESFKQNILKYSDYNFIPILFGTTVFELFRRIDVKKNKVINFIGGGTLMVYLIHGNALCYTFWWTQDWIQLLYDCPCLYVFKHVMWSVFTFAVGIIAYCCYCCLSMIIPKLKVIIEFNENKAL